MLELRCGLTAIGLDLWTLTVWEIKVFSTKPQKVRLFAGGSTATKVVGCCFFAFCVVGVLFVGWGCRKQSCFATHAKGWIVKLCFGRMGVRF